MASMPVGRIDDEDDELIDESLNAGLLPPAPGQLATASAGAGAGSRPLCFGALLIGLLAFGVRLPRLLARDLRGSSACPPLCRPVPKPAARCAWLTLCSSACLNRARPCSRRGSTTRSTPAPMPARARIR